MQLEKQSQQNKTTKLTQEQLKKRRREKILTRSEIVQSEDMPTSHVEVKPNPKSKQASISAYQMFKTSQDHQKTKVKLQIAGIALGFISGIFHLFTNLSPYIFGSFFSILLLLVVYNQISRMNRVSRFASTNQTKLDPLIMKVNNIKQLQIINKVLSFKQATTPLTKLFAVFFFVIIVFGYLNKVL